jgi:hypothetical protein
MRFLPLVRLNVPFDEPEYQALSQMAHDECREPRNQVRALVRRAAIERGLLPVVGARHEAEASVVMPVREGEV